MINIDKKIKKKIINHNIITNRELKMFIDYVIYKSNIITKYMATTEAYTQINLCNEILWSHNLDSTIYKENNRYYCIFNINNKNYLLDIDFNDKKIKYLKENKYIELNDNILNTYLNIIGGQLQ